MNTVEPESTNEVVGPTWGQAVSQTNVLSSLAAYYGEAPVGLAQDTEDVIRTIDLVNRAYNPGAAVVRVVVTSAESVA